MARWKCARTVYIMAVTMVVVIGTRMFLTDESQEGSGSWSGDRGPRRIVIRGERTPSRRQLIEMFSLHCINCSTAGTNTTNSTTSLESRLRDHILNLNNEQIVNNLDRFDLIADGDGALVIVVQVHNRTGHLRHLISSLQRARHISEVLLIFSHDYYSDELNSLVKSVDFCPVMQIFYPYSIQLFPKEFPGEDPRDCPRNADRQQATALKCLNADSPDKYGHYREAIFSQIKHHWFWKMNHVFDHMTATKYFNGLVLNLEEDHYVAPDFIHVLRQMYRLRLRVCMNCSIFTLGTYDKAPSFTLASKVDVISWTSSKHNMGMAFDRRVWNLIKACGEKFCQYDDYNWDWSLNAVGVTCMPAKLKAIVVKSPRVFHTGECGGVHSKKRDSCEPPEAKATVVDQLLNEATSSLFPVSLSVNGYPYTPDRVPRPNGGWGDIRDHKHCTLLMSNSTHQ